MTLILRDYQRNCVEAVRDSFKAGNKKVLCALATASGKTVIAASIVQQYLAKNPDKRVLFLSHLSILVDQTGDSFYKHFDIKSDVLQASEIPLADSKCIVSTIQSFKSEEKVQEWANKLNYSTGKTIKALNIGLVFIDECHHAFLSNTHKAIDAILPDVNLIGLSATPIKENKLITDHFDDVAFSLSTQELIDLGYCVPPELKVLAVNPLDETELYSTMIASYKQSHSGQKAIIFLKTIEECMNVASLFELAGVNALAITSKLTGRTRTKSLNDFRSNKEGSLEVLTTVNVLTAGFDSPNIQVIYMPYKVSSVVMYVQRCGRGLRICPEIGKTKCTVYAASKTPILESGQWEKMNKVLLGANSKKEQETYLDDLDLTLLTETKKRWTMEIVRMAKAIEGKGLINLSNMIIGKKFPEDLLDVMRGMPISKPYKLSKAKLTPAQAKVLDRYEVTTDLTKQEASIVIDGISRKEGWTIPKWKMVQSGRYKGRQWKDVPFMYLKALHWGDVTKKEWNLYRSRLKQEMNK